jgi:hypothetical protein
MKGIWMSVNEWIIINILEWYRCMNDEEVWWRMNNDKILIKILPDYRFIVI